MVCEGHRWMYNCNSTPGKIAAAKTKCILILSWSAWPFHPRHHPKDGLENTVHSHWSSTDWNGFKSLLVSQIKIRTDAAGASQVGRQEVRLDFVGPEESLKSIAYPV